MLAPCKLVQHALRRARLAFKKRRRKKKRLKKIVMFVSVVNPLGYSYSNIKFKNTCLIYSTLQLSHSEQDRKHKTSTTMASTAALFDRQQLQSREDMLMLGQILNDVMQHFIEVRVYPFSTLPVCIRPTVFQCLVLSLGDSCQ